MKRSEVEIGETYFAKVSGRLAKVRIMRLHSGSFGDLVHTGWDAINVATGREIHIKTAARLRGKA